MMPQTARKVMELVAKDSTTAQDLANVIEKDANITARVLKIANSAFYGLRREVTTVAHAIMVLGYKSVRSLVIASSSKNLHRKFGITEQLMWDHSIGTAISAKVLSEREPQAVGELAFVGGLLHNVGKTVMNNHCPEAYAEVMRRVYNDELHSIEAEKAVFGYTYPEVGARVVEKWGLPQRICRVIGYHHLSSLEEGHREALFQEENELKEALAFVEFSSSVCRYLGVGFKDKKTDLNLEGLQSAKILEISSEKIPEWIEACEKSIETEKAVFDD